MRSVSVFMDVEDPVNPLADDAAFDIAFLFTTLGVRGSFCLTGEKCRKLECRRRSEAVEAFSHHCLGLHTDTHSEHPTTMELLETLSYEQGCSAVFEVEKRGYDAFLELFDGPPAFWGGAGNTWSPEVTDALSRLRVPAYSYALTSLPDEAVHRFNGVMALPQALSISEASWADDVKARTESDRILASLRATDRPWTGVFVGHPTRFRFAEFWDKDYMSGITPTRLHFAEPVSDSEYDSAKHNLGKFLVRLKAEFQVIGVDAALELPWTFRRPTLEEREYFEKETARKLAEVAGWPIHRTGLNPSNIIAKTMAMATTLEVAVLNQGR